MSSRPTTRRGYAWSPGLPSHWPSSPAAGAARNPRRRRRGRANPRDERLLESRLVARRVDRRLHDARQDHRDWSRRDGSASLLSPPPGLASAAAWSPDGASLASSQDAEARDDGVAIAVELRRGARSTIEDGPGSWPSVRSRPTAPEDLVTYRCSSGDSRAGAIHDLLDAARSTTVYGGGLGVWAPDGSTLVYEWYRPCVLIVHPSLPAPGSLLVTQRDHPGRARSILAARALNPTRPANSTTLGRRRAWGRTSECDGSTPTISVVRRTCWQRSAARSSPAAATPGPDCCSRPTAGSCSSPTTRRPTSPTPRSSASSGARA